jgi:toxin HigB-1
MILSFNCRETERIWHGHSSRKFPSDIQDRALRKLRQVAAARTIDDLRNPPINDQWRICRRGDRRLPLSAVASRRT